MDKIDIFYIAKKAGVSIATVSRVLNKPETVDKKKVKLVLEMCSKYNYKPSHFAKAIRTGKTKNIALVVHTMSAFSKNTELIESVENRIYDYSYCLNIFNTNMDPDRQKKIISIIKDRSIDGVLLQNSGFWGHSFDLEVIDKINNINIPLFILEKQMEESKTAFASVDGEKGGGIAAKHLIKKGHRKVGVLSDPLGYDIICQRVEGFSKQCKKDRINKIPVFELPEANNTLPNLVSIIKNRLTEITESKVTAVFCTSDVIALALYKVLTENNIQVPEDISIIGFDNLSATLSMPVGLTTINNDLKLLGKIGVDNLISKIENGRFLKKQSVIEPELIVRDTVSKRS